VGGKSGISPENCKISRNIEKLRKNKKNKDSPDYEGYELNNPERDFLFFWFSHILQILGEFSGLNLEFLEKTWKTLQI
jgi:hypothetical protein